MGARDRSIDGDGETQAFVARKEHGHPEEGTINLSRLKTIVYYQEQQPLPCNVAAQFVFLDTLRFVFRDESNGDLQRKLAGLSYSPAQSDIEQAETFLHEHTSLDSTSEVEPISYIYTVELPDEGDWQIEIGENTHSFDGLVGGGFWLVSWDFSGEISDAGLLSVVDIPEVQT